MDHKNDEFLSIRQYVQFKDVETEYVQGETLRCCYDLTGYASQEGDRIAIYKVGWNSVKQYVAFEWVPVNDNAENVVSFNKYSLPKNTTDLFQLCYISNRNETYGVSPPFQFVEAKPKHYDSMKLSICDSAYDCGDSEKEISELKAENRVLRQKMNALTNIIVGVQNLVLQQQIEVDTLKEKVEGLIGRKKKEAPANLELEELEPLPPFPWY